MAKELDEKQLKAICRQAGVKYDGVNPGDKAAGIDDLVLFSWRGRRFTMSLTNFDAVTARKVANPPERRRMVWQTRLRQLSAKLEDLEKVHELEQFRAKDMHYGGKIADAWAVLYGLVLRSPVEGLGRGVTYLRQSGERLTVDQRRLERQKARLARREARGLVKVS